MKTNKSNLGSAAVILSVLLTFFFTILRLLQVIKWSWIWVLSPLWIGLAAAITFTVLAVVIVAICEYMKEREKLKKAKERIMTQAARHGLKQEPRETQDQYIERIAKVVQRSGYIGNPYKNKMAYSKYFDSYIRVMAYRDDKNWTFAKCTPSGVVTGRTSDAQTPASSFNWQDIPKKKEPDNMK